MPNDKIVESNAFFADINDFVDENEIDSFAAVISDIDVCVEKIEIKRSNLRSLSNQIKLNIGETKFEAEFAKNVEMSFANIKTYIKSAKDLRKSIRAKEKADFTNKEISNEKHHFEITKQKIETTGFVINEIFRIINELSKDFQVSKETSNDEIVKKESNLQLKLCQCENLAKKIQYLLDTVPPEYPDKESVLQTITEAYEKLIFQKKEYVENLKTEIQTRELSKEKLFSSSNLNIKLEKFRGYESKPDIYSFQSI